MECLAARGLFHLYEDGVLQPWERKELEDHLASCGPCRREMKALRDTLQLLERLEPVPAPWGLAERVMARIRAEGAPRQVPSGRWAPLLGGGMLLVALLGLFLLFQAAETVVRDPTMAAQSSSQEALSPESFSLAETDIILGEMEDRWLAFLENLVEAPGRAGLGFILGACLLLAVGWVLLARLIAAQATAAPSAWLSGASDQM